jgi:DNA-binding beta-propeller fold protein YncE
VDEEIRFYIVREEDGRRTVSAGPLSDDELRDAIRRGRFSSDTKLRLAGSDIVAPVDAWATFASRRVRHSAPPPSGVATQPPEAFLAAPRSAIDMLLWSVHENGRTVSPLTGEEVRDGLASGGYQGALISLVGSGSWWPIATVFSHDELSTTRLVRCPTCLEEVPIASAVCPECAEPLGVSSAPASASREASLHDEAAGPSWLSLHWRPLLTMGAMMAVVCTGITLRYLAPGRFMPPLAAARPAAAVAPACASACWAGESCQMGECVWQSPKDVRHIPSNPVVSGPFALPKDVSDALPLDGDRFAVAVLAGTEVRNARTGEVLSLVSEAPHTRRLFRVDDVVYASAPQRIYVIDAATTRLLKTIEVGAPVGQLAVGASGRRALASLPQSHAVAILATEYHAEIDRIPFGDDIVGPVGTDDTGRRALTTTGQVPLAGLQDPQGGAVYAFDPGRLASKQDRVRAAMLGNPVSVLMTPDGDASFVALRAEDALVPLEWLPSGAVRRHGRIPTCRQPEQLELVRRGRRAIVRCNLGRALEVFDLSTRALLKRIPFGSRASDIAVSPDGLQAVVALSQGGSGALAFVDLETYELRLLPLAAEPSRVRLSPDGSSLLVLSDRSKAAWVIR